MKTDKKPLKKSSEKASENAIRKPAAKKDARKTAAKKLSQTAKPKANEEQKFPGYPKYPASEDIMNNGDQLEGNLDDEVLTGQRVDMSRTKDQADTMDDKEMPEGAEDELKPAKKSQYDVTHEDLEALGSEELSMDMGDDEQLKHRDRPVDFTGKDLDVPGSELDDEAEETGAEDEENNSYSRQP